MTLARSKMCKYLKLVWGWQIWVKINPNPYSVCSDLHMSKHRNTFCRLCLSSYKHTWIFRVTHTHTESVSFPLHVFHPRNLSASLSVSYHAPHPRKPPRSHSLCEELTTPLGGCDNAIKQGNMSTAPRKYQKKNKEWRKIGCCPSPLSIASLSIVYWLSELARLWQRNRPSGKRRIWISRPQDTTRCSFAKGFIK